MCLFAQKPFLQASVTIPDGSDAQDVQEAIVVLNEGKDQVLLRDPVSARRISAGATQASNS